mmetsp:Transcript_12169/g.32747  ORF Transcript_12169/g.32747 Transcript_12169/m.32747 type:complete len:296 (-) Transcript_12169:211-1098(-)
MAFFVLPQTATSLSVRSSRLSHSKRAVCELGMSAAVGTGSSLPVLSRRTLLRASVAAAFAATLAPCARAEANAPSFELPPLKHDYAAWEPAIDAATMKLHHDKHHAAYTKKLNDALQKLVASKQAATLADELSKSASIAALGKLLHKDMLAMIDDAALANALRNNGGGYINHSIFFDTLRPAKKIETAPGAKLMPLIEASFGSTEKLLDELRTKSAGVFGSGWVWLYRDAGQSALKIGAYPNQDSPLRDSSNAQLLFGIDLWEHAFYLKYQNRRPEYVDAVLSIIDWDAVEQRLA